LQVSLPLVTKIRIPGLQPYRELTPSPTDAGYGSFGCMTL
jgi:hypothetical protein